MGNVALCDKLEKIIWNEKYDRIPGRINEELKTNLTEEDFQTFCMFEKCYFRYHITKAAVRIILGKKESKRLLKHFKKAFDSWCEEDESKHYHPLEADCLFEQLCKKLDIK